MVLEYMSYIEISYTIIKILRCSGNQTSKSCKFWARARKTPKFTKQSIYQPESSTPSKKSKPRLSIN